MNHETETDYKDTRNKAEKIKDAIKSTLYNMEAADEMITQTPQGKVRRELEEKNVRRAEALPSMVREMKEEEAKKELELEN